MPPNTLSPPAVSLAAAVPTDDIWRLTVDQYHQMIDADILTEDDPVELLEGCLVTKMTKNPSHSLVNRLLRDALERIVPADWHVNIQEPITLDTSEPEPDASVARGRPRDYADHHPRAQDVAMVAEIAASSLARDQRLKKRIYARARIGVYWIVNLIDQKVEVYTEPSGPAEAPDYGQRRDFGLTERVPLVIDGKEVGSLAVQELFA